MGAARSLGIRIAAVIGGLGAILAFAAPPAVSKAPPGRTLVIRVTGLSATAAAPVRLVGPGVRQVLEVRGVLRVRGLSPGRYRIRGLQTGTYITTGPVSAVVTRRRGARVPVAYRQAGSVFLASSTTDGQAGNESSNRPVWTRSGSALSFATYAPNLLQSAFTFGQMQKVLATGVLQPAVTLPGGASPGQPLVDAVESPDATRIAFVSSAGLVPGLPADQSQVFVLDSASGVLRIVSATTAGTPGNANSGSPVWSPDGTRVAFVSHSSNLAAGDTNDESDVFVKDLATGQLSTVSAVGGVPGNGSSATPTWSPDGTRVAFSSFAHNLVPGGLTDEQDIFVKNLVTGVVQRISTSASGQPGNESSYGPSWSPVANRIVFQSFATNLLPAVDSNGDRDIFVKNLDTGAVRLVSRTASGRSGNGSSQDADWSASGTRITFASDASNLVPGDTNGTADVFVVKVASGPASRISVKASGAQSNGWSGEPVWSPDGRRVAFASEASNLMPGLVVGVYETNVFIKTLQD